MAPPHCFKKNQRFWSQFEESSSALSPSADADDRSASWSKIHERQIDGLRH
jgi:hypothetical protein